MENSDRSTKENEVIEMKRNLSRRKEKKKKSRQKDAVESEEGLSGDLEAFPHEEKRERTRGLGLEKKEKKKNRTSGHRRNP